MRTLISVILIAFSLISNAQTEHRKYAIKVIGIKVGELVATRSTSPEKEISYTLKSSVNVSFLVYKLKVDYRVLSKFQAKEMSLSEVSVKSNKGDFSTKTTKLKEGYKVSSVQPEKNVEKRISSKITSTFSQIHFEEPSDLTPVYAEFYGDFIKIKKLRNHVYAGVLDDNRDEYYYQNGALIKAVKKNPITDLVIEFEKSWLEEK